MISLDTETTGVDIRHGARPFFVTFCNPEGEQEFWEWDVNPLTREPIIPEDDLWMLKKCIEDSPTLVLQNAKFDAHALQSIIPSLQWDWHKVWDTLVASHILASNRPHDLTSLGIQYLGRNIQPFEDRLKDACMEARRYCRSHLKNWRIAKEGLPEMPSAKSSSDKKKDPIWKYDTWLLRALRKAGHFKDRPEWDTLLAEYANEDSAITICLWPVMKEILHKRGLWEIFLIRRQHTWLAHRMENNGVTYSKERLDDLKDTFSTEVARCKAICTNIAAEYNYNLVLPKGSNNNSLHSFIFDVMKLPAGKCSEATGKPSLDKTVLEDYLVTLPPKSKQLLFVQSLINMRKRGTAITYMDGYDRYSLPLSGQAKDWRILYPNINPTGTDHLRWSMSNPNGQNISKQEGFNLRHGFGPAPGREWWSLDAKNIERRIPAYEADEKEIIALFEHPDDPPYFGSEHALVAHILHPKLFAECINDKGQLDGRIFKKRFAATWYQWTKNGNFAIQYGCQKAKADSTYHVAGAYEKIKARFKNQDALNQYWINHADKYGYVETIPDKTVNPKHGYPILCARTEYGRVLPTVPLNYHVSGTAMWWMGKAMIRCQAQLDEWNNHRSLPFQGFMTLQVHDELVFDFPRSKKHPREEIGNTSPFRLSNLWRIEKLKKLMEQGGDDIGIPTPVGVEYHTETWADGETFNI